MFDSLRGIIAATFDRYNEMSTQELLDSRYNRFRVLGNNVTPLEPVLEEKPQPEL